MPPPQISIPRPCHEAWAAMTPTGQGRHCAACQKTVVDFSRQSPAEILAFLQRPRSEEVCGRFRPAQVQPKYPARLLTWRPTPWLALSIVAVLTLTHCSPDTAPNATPANTAPPVAVVPPPKGTLLHGQVLDVNYKRPLAGALIICEADTLCQTHTDAEGRFSLFLPHRLRNSRLVAAMPAAPNPRNSEDDIFGPLLPCYFDAADSTTVMLRRPPMIIGMMRKPTKEATEPAIVAYLRRRGFVKTPSLLPEVITENYPYPNVQ